MTRPISAIVWGIIHGLGNLTSRGVQWNTSAKILSLALLLFLLAGCQTQAPPPADPFAGVIEAKLLATVYISPTPDDIQRQATQAAVVLVPTLPRATSAPTPTPYIGVFLGEIADVDAQPDFQAVDFATPLPLTGATATAASCVTLPDERFGTRWQSETAVVTTLGCPGEPAAALQGTTQVFERGLMLFIPGGEIWAIAPAVPAGRYWYTPQAPPPQSEPISAPEGLRVPLLGFGAVWTTTPGVRDALGFARTDESAASILVQRFLGGTLIQDVSVGQTFALLGSGASGTAYGPY